MHISHNCFSLVKPFFTKIPLDVLAMAGEHVELQCEAQGEPTPQMHWSKKEGKLAGDR